MGDITPPSLTFDQVKTGFGDSFRQIQANPSLTDDDMLQTVMGGRATFVSPSTLTTAQLLSTYPAAANVLGKYAKVNDLWGGVSTVMICEGDASGYYWRPQRTDYAQNMTIAQGSVSLIPLLTPTTIRMVGTITGNITLTPSLTNVWPGAFFDVVVKTAIPALVSININGLIGGGTVPLVQGSSRRLSYYQGAGWDAA